MAAEKAAVESARAKAAAAAKSPVASRRRPRAELRAITWSERRHGDAPSDAGDQCDGECDGK